MDTNMPFDAVSAGSERASGAERLSQLAWTATEPQPSSSTMHHRPPDEDVDAPRMLTNFIFEDDSQPWWSKVSESFSKSIDNLISHPAARMQEQPYIEKQIAGADESFKTALGISKQQLANISHGDYARASSKLNDAVRTLRSNLVEADPNTRMQVQLLMSLRVYEQLLGRSSELQNLDPKLVAAIKAVEAAESDPVLKRIDDVRQQIGPSAMFSSVFRDEYARLLVEEGRTGDALVELVKSREHSRRFLEATTP